MNRIVALAILILAPAAANATAALGDNDCNTGCVAPAAAAPIQVALVLPAAPTLDDAAQGARDGILVLTQSADDWRPTRDVVRQVQQTLTTMGYDPGPVDGMMGPGTDRAIREFQADREIEQTGEVTQALVALLEEEINGQGGPEADGVVQETTENAPPDIEQESLIEITDDPSTYDLGDLKDLNTFD